MGGKPVGFNVRALYALKPDRLYRVYAMPDGLYLIRIAGQGGLEGQALTLGAAGGALGMMLASILTPGAGTSYKKAAAADEQGPLTQLGHHKHDQRVRVDEIVECSIEPPSRLPSHGPQAARWLLTTREQKWNLQFETNEDVVIALDHLPPILGERLKVNIEWSPTAGKYVQKQSGLQGKGSEE